MRYAVPVTENKVAAHFGHCQYFALFDVEDSRKEILSKSMVAAPEHEPGLLPRWLAEEGVSVVIAGGMGSRAQDIFRQNNIQVIVGASETDPEKAVIGYLQGNLSAGNNLCDH